VNILKSGMLFTDYNNNPYMLSDSSNMRWMVNLVTGHASWIAKINEGTIEFLDKKGFKYIGLASDITDGIKEEIKDNSKDKDVITYDPLNLFNSMINKIKTINV